MKMVSDYPSTRLSQSVAASILKTQAEHSKLLNKILVKLESISCWITINGQTRRQNDSFPDESDHDSVEAEASKSNSTEQNVEEEYETLVIAPAAPVQCTDPLCTCLTCCPRMMMEIEFDPDVNPSIVENQNQSELNPVSTPQEITTKPCLIKLIKLPNLPLPQIVPGDVHGIRKPQKHLHPPEPEPLPPRCLPMMLETEVNVKPEVDISIFETQNQSNESQPQVSKSRQPQVISQGIEADTIAKLLSIHLKSFQPLPPLPPESEVKEPQSNSTVQPQPPPPEPEVEEKPPNSKVPRLPLPSKLVVEEPHNNSNVPPQSQKPLISQLLEPLQTTQSGKVFACQLQGCGMVYSNKTKFRLHCYKHTGFRCSQCNATFAQHPDLKRHLARHIFCQIQGCGKPLLGKIGLIEHMKKCHTKKVIKVFKCDLCGKILKTNNNLKLHKSSCEKKNLKRLEKIS